MGIKRVVAQNAIWNWLGMGVSMLAGFLVAPFLVHRLGETNYGLWILIASMTGYFGLLDFGIKGSVGRHLAFYRARNDQARVNAILNTALVCLAVAGLLAVLAIFAVQFLFFRLFDVPADQVGAVRLALFIVGLNLSMALILNVFDGVLWSKQRFDLLNMIDVVGILVRTCLTFWFIGIGHGLIALALITLLTTVGTGCLKALTSFRIEPALRLSPTHVTKEAARRIFGYGSWYFVISVARMATTQLSPLIIGARLAIHLVTPYSVATRLVGYTNALFMSGTGVLTPVATTLHAEQKHREQQQMFLEGGKYCLAASLCFFMGLLFLGKPFILLWMGPRLENAAGLLAILAAGEILPMSQWISGGIILGMGRHKIMALVGIMEGVAALSLMALLVGFYGLVGVCVAAAIPAAICRGIVIPIYACRLMRLSPWIYARNCLVPSLGAAAMPLAALWVATYIREPGNWPELVCYGLVFTFLYASSALLFLCHSRLKTLFAPKSPEFAQASAFDNECSPLCG